MRDGGKGRGEGAEADRRRKRGAFSHVVVVRTALANLANLVLTLPFLPLDPGDKHVACSYPLIFSSVTSNSDL